jgi:transcriptional regulator with GAF, ATPase, and Fis domain
MRILLIGHGYVGSYLRPSLEAAGCRVTVCEQVAAKLSGVAHAVHCRYQELTIGDLAGSRSFVIVPLRRGGVTLGSITLYRQEVRPFTPREISLVESFAAQAVIAMENARLLGELRESLDQQTATTEVLAAINSSPGDLKPVFESMLEKAHALCRVEHGSLQLYDGTMFSAVAVHNLPEALAARLRERYAPGPAFQRLIEGADFDHTPDVAEVDDQRRVALAAVMV